LLPGSLLLLLGTDEQEIEDNNDEQEGQHSRNSRRQSEGSQQSDEGQRAVLLAGRVRDRLRRTTESVSTE
jgi:hypothetical protein